MQTEAVKVDSSFFLAGFLGSPLPLVAGMWKVWRRKHQLCSFNSKTSEAQHIATQRSVSGDRSRSRKPQWKGSLVRTNSKVAKSCRRLWWWGQCSTLWRYKPLQKGLQSRWRLLWTCRRVQVALSWGAGLGAILPHSISRSISYLSWTLDIFLLVQFPPQPE